MLHDKGKKTNIQKENSTKTSSLMDSLLNNGAGASGLNSLMQNLNAGSLFNKGNGGSLLQNLDLGSIFKGVDFGTLFNNVDMEAMLKGDTSSLLKNVDKNTVTKIASNLLNADPASETLDLSQQDLSALLNMPLLQGTELTTEIPSLLAQLENMEKQIANIKNNIEQLDQNK